MSTHPAGAGLPGGASPALLDLPAKIAYLELIERRGRRLQALVCRLAEATSASEAAQSVVDEGAELFGARGTLLFLLSDDVLMLQAFAGVSADRATLWDRLPVGGAVPMSVAVRTGEPV